jgi:hypothetical protein
MTHVVSSILIMLPIKLVFILLWVSRNLTGPWEVWYSQHEITTDIVNIKFPWVNADKIMKITGMLPVILPEALPRQLACIIFWCILYWSTISYPMPWAGNMWSYENRVSHLGSRHAPTVNVIQGHMVIQTHLSALLLLHKHWEHSSKYS